MSSFPYVDTSNVFNTADYRILNEGLTRDTADKLYLSLGGGLINGNLNINGTLSLNGDAIDLSLISGVVAGTPQNSKALSLDSSGKINGALTLTGTITSLVSIATTMTCNGVDIGSNIAPLVGITLGTPAASKALTLNASSQIAGSLSLTGNLTATNITGTLQTAAQTNITSIGTLNNLTVTGTITSLASIATTMTCNGVDIGSNIAPLVGVTPGTATASKALVIDASKNIIGLNAVRMDSDLYMSQTAVLRICRDVSTGDLNSTIYSDGIASLCLSSIRGGGQVKVLTNANSANNCFTINNATSGTNHLTMRADSKTGLYTNTPGYGLDVQSSLNCTSLYLNGTQMTATATELNVLAGITAGAALASKALVLNASKNITGINNLTSNTVITTSRSTSGNSFNSIAGSSQAGIYHLLNSNCQFGTFTINDLEIISGNTAAMTISSFDQSISGITSLSANNLTATNLTGTLQTVAQPNITSVGTLSSLSTGSLTLGGTLITAYASEINTLAGVVAGSAGAGKALVLDMSKNIATLNSLTSNYLVCNTAINGSNALGTMKALNLGGIVLDYGVMSLKGSGTKPSVSFGSTNSLIWMESSHGTPIEAEINVSSGTSSTSTNALRMGTCSNNDFNLFTNNTERVVIRAGGEVLIKRFLQVGDSTDTSRMISCLDSTMTSTNLRYITLGKTATAGNQAEIAYQWIGDNDDTNSLRFGFYGGEKMRLTRWGSLLVNSTNNSYSATPTKFASEAAGATEWCAVFKNTSAANNKCVGFINNSALEVGSITWGTGTTSFNTTSDYRLKKDIKPMTNCLELVNRLNPVRYNWISEYNEPAEGFIAHELQEVLPLCVVGKKDAVYEDGSINPQSIDYGKLTPHLVAAVKELTDINIALSKKIEDLESKVKNILSYLYR